MTKLEARQASKLLETSGCREIEIIRYDRSWRVYATDNATGYRFHTDSIEALRDRLIGDA